MKTPPCLGAIRLLLAALLAVPGAFAQPANRFADVKTWYGTYSYRLSATDSKPGDFTAHVDARVDGTFTLTQNEEHPNWWDGKIENSQAHFSLKVVHDKGGSNCQMIDTFESSGPVVQHLPSQTPSDTPEVQLTVYPNKWRVHMARALLPGVFRKSGCLNIAAPTAVAFPFDTPEFSLPSGGDALEVRSFKVTQGIPIAGWAFQRAVWEGDIRLSPTRDEFVLDVDSPDYKTWMPEDVAVGKPGRPIELTATLRRKSGAPAGVRILRMEWELINTSREPGIAINYPLYARDTEPDMQFDPKPGQQSNDRDRQQLTTNDVKNDTDTVSILPYDWGGWTTLRVKAYVEGQDEPVIGKLKESGEEDIRVPKRRSGSLIADAWREQMKRAGRDGADGGDSSDDEKLIHPNAFPGDGLTLYEEYRGFYEQGQHKRGDPSKCDLFVRDETDGSVDGGIATFERMTGIVVHRLRADEFDDKGRVVNGNKSAGAHVVDQHAILITWIDKTGNKADGSGLYYATVPQGAKSPADVKYIILPRQEPTGNMGADGKTAYKDASFAHELLHAVGVRHHGPPDRYVYWKVEPGGVVLEYETFTETASGAVAVTGPGTPIRIMGTSGANDVTQRWAADHPAGQKQQVGIWGGQSSGDVRCVMRYDINGAYEKHGAPGVRVLIKSGDEPVGYDICTASTGTGINASTAPGGPRYGDAPNGNCASQIRVSDRR